MQRRLVSAAFVVAAVAAASVSGAGATTDPTMRVIPVVGPPGSSVTVKASGFSPRERIHVSFDGTVEVSAIANTVGGLKRSFAVPASALPGTHDVNATGLTFGLSADTSFLVQTDWPQFGDTPDHQSDNTAENVLSVKNVSQLVVDWTQPAARAPDAYAAPCPVVAGGVVYTAAVGTTEDAFDAVDAGTGAVDWSQPNLATGGCPAVSNGIVYSVVYPDPGSGWELEAVNAASGAPVWSHSVVGIPESPTVAGKVVYVVSGGALYAMNAGNGKTLWRNSGLSSVAVAGGVVYARTDEGEVEALDAATDRLIWSRAPGSSQGLLAPVVAAFHLPQP